MAQLYAHTGATDRARAYLDAYRQEVPPEQQSEGGLRGAEIRIAWGEGRYEDAISEALQAEGGRCAGPGWNVARAYYLAGRADSAIAYMERAVTMPRLVGHSADAFYRPLFYGTRLRQGASCPTCLRRSTLRSKRLPERQEGR